jgi:hypothetical protein
MRGFYGEKIDFVGTRKAHKPCYLAIKVQLSYVNFDGQFPNGCDAKVYGIGQVIDNTIRAT